MDPRNEISEARKKKRRSHRLRQFGKFLITVAFIILAIIGLSQLTASRVVNIRDGLKVVLSTTGEFPIINTGSVHTDVRAMSGSFAVLSKDEISCYTTSGKQLLNESHKHANACIETTDNRMILFNRGSKEYDIFSRTEKLYSGILDTLIIDANITSAGCPIILKESARYTGELTLYSANNFEELFTWYCTDAFPYKVFLSDSNNNAVVAAITLDSGGLKTKLYYIDLASYSETTVKTIDSLVVKCFMKGSSTIIVTDKEFLNLSANNSVYYSYDFNDLPLISLYCVPNEPILVALGDNSKIGVNSLKIFSDSKHELIGEINDLDSIDCVYATKNTVYILSGNKISEYTSKGELITTFDVDNEVVSFIVSNNIFAVLPNSIIKY